MQTKKNIFLWILYDFANSIIMITFFLYFSQWIVIEKGLPDIYFNLNFTATAIMLLCTIPITGVLLDKYFRRITGLRYTTVFTSLFYLMCTVFAIYDKEIPALIFFTLGSYMYLLTFSFYTPLINDISNKENIGKISGLGIMANYIGQFTGLLLALPFSNGIISFFNTSSRLETFLPAIIVFSLLTLPTLIFFKEDYKNAGSVDLKKEFKNVFSETRKMFLLPGVGLFLLSYFFFNDAILTASNNFPIFLQQVWGVSDTVKTYILLSIIFTSAIGGIVSGAIADTYGHKKTLVFIVSTWIILLPLVAFVTNFILFIVCTTVMGFWFGATWAVSRSMMSDLSSGNSHNLIFGYFGLVERVSSFVGPIVWGVTLSSLMSIGVDRYRFATLAVTGFIVIGLGCLVRVRRGFC